MRLYERIVALPSVYNCVQSLAGLKHTKRRLQPLLADLEGLTVLDVGAGTGNYRALMPPGVRYVWLDNDPQKLKGFIRAHSPAMAILGDVTRIPLRDRSVDAAFCCAVSHHLSDAEVQALFSEMARVCRKRAIFLDAIDVPSSFISRLLWRYDRGSFPRDTERLRLLMDRDFRVIHDESYTIYHSYVLWAGIPKRSTPSGGSGT